MTHANTSASPAMITIEGLSKQFGSLMAVDHLSLEVHHGEVFCFLGPNGAGKTTTIKMMCGLLKPTAGTIHINGINLSDNPVNVRQISGYIPDQPYMYDRLTTIEYCEFVADLFRIPRPVTENKIDLYFDLFDLHEYRSVLIRDLSHGLRQRLIYAATFLHDPQVLFVDEPFVGLDPFSIRTIRTTLRKKAAQGVTVFLTTHILALAEGLADRIGIINQGKLVACGTMEELSSLHGAAGNLEDVFLHLTS